MNTLLSMTEIEELLDSSYNYENIRILAVDLFYRNNPNIGISEKCKIISNPYRTLFFDYPNEQGLEKYIDYELMDQELPTSIAKHYKKCFAKAFQLLFNQNRLERTYAN